MHIQRSNNSKLWNFNAEIKHLTVIVIIKLIINSFTYLDNGSRNTFLFISENNHNLIREVHIT